MAAALRLQQLPQPTTPAEANFSLKLRQQTTCVADAVLPLTSVIVYDESPLTNANTNFTAYRTDANGFLGLALPENSSVSFSISANTAGGEKKVYTFNELTLGDYDFNPTILRRVRTRI